jgi:TolB-like protein/DNA-binding winged helix-turn-helix (wHTH) protein
MSDLDYRLGEWIVRPHRDILERGEQVVHVKPKAMAVLCRLAQAHGETVTRSDIFDAVWLGATVSDAVLTQCVVELRQAFGDSARDPEIIETIPRIGFRLIPPVTPLDADETSAHIQSAPAATGPEKKPGRIRLALRLAGLAVLLLGGWHLSTTLGLFAPEPEPDARSLAVLPFADVSDAHDQDEFAAGLTEELITRLSQLQGLQVASRAASFRAGSEGGSLQAIANELGVNYLVEGSVRKSGRQLRVTAQLTDTRDGFHLWSETFDRPLEDIFAIQEEITESVVVALAITLDVGEFAGDPLATSSVEAYEEGLKSQQAHAEFTGDSLLRAIHHVKRAVEIDPEYGYAWYALASLYREAGAFKGVIAEEDWMQLSVEALDRAIALDPDPNAGLEMKITLAEEEHRWMDAQELAGPLTGREMVEDSPRNFFYAYLLYDVGRVDEAVPLMEHWKRLHPGGPGTRGGLAVMYTAQERYNEAFAEVEAAYDTGRYSEFGALAGVIAALSANDREQLSYWMELVMAHTEGDGIRFWQGIEETLDDRLAALAFLRTVDSDSTAYVKSIWAAWYGDVELALSAMRRSDTTYAFWIPLMKDVRRHPGFKDLVRDMNLVEYWREYGWADSCRPIGEDDFECE